MSLSKDMILPGYKFFYIRYFCVSQNKSPSALQNCGHLKHHCKIICQCFTASPCTPLGQQQYIWSSDFQSWVPYLTASLNFALVLYISFQLVYFFLPFIFWGCQSHLKLSMEKLNYFLYLSPKPQHCRSLTSANVLSADILYGHSHSVFLLSSTLVSGLDTRLENVFCVGVSS